MNEEKKETDTLEISIKKISEEVIARLPQIIKEKLESSYDNPIKEALDSEFKAVDGIIRLKVKELLKKVMEDKQMEEELLETLKNQLIKKVLIDR